MSNEKQKIDVAIVGGGVVGLWSALAVQKQFPDLSVVVFEAEKFLGEHTSGRNSEVLHSGIYYPTCSLKHLHCLQGNELWREYVGRKNLPFLSCGKVIAATSAQAARLEELFQQGTKNTVPGMRRLSGAEVAGYQGALHIDSGFFCETSGVLNVAESLASLRSDFEVKGGIVMVQTKAKLQGRDKDGFLLEVAGDQILAARLVNAAGLSAVEFRASLGLGGFENFYVKGSYLKLKRRLPFDKLIYPLPPPSGLGLGVHLTLDTAGEQKFGPDTEIVDTVGYALADSLLTRMAPAIDEVFKGVCPEDLQLGYAGVRPKVKKNGTLVTDFVFQTSCEHGIDGYFEFLGIESPGVTAAPSLAKMLVDSL